MNEEELIEVLRSMEDKRVEQLDENAKKLFNAVMKIADKRDKLQNNWNELKNWLEEEKNRLATGVSNTYEDSLGKRRFVNEDIFNELTKVSEKMQALENDNNE